MLQIFHTRISRHCLHTHANWIIEAKFGCKGNIRNWLIFTFLNLLNSNIKLEKFRELCENAVLLQKKFYFAQHTFSDKQMVINNNVINKKISFFMFLREREYYNRLFLPRFFIVYITIYYHLFIGKCVLRKETFLYIIFEFKNIKVKSISYISPTKKVLTLFHHCSLRKETLKWFSKTYRVPNLYYFAIAPFRRSRTKCRPTSVPPRWRTAWALLEWPRYIANICPSFATDAQVSAVSWVLSSGCYCALYPVTDRDKKKKRKKNVRSVTSVRFACENCAAFETGAKNHRDKYLKNRGFSLEISFICRI